MAFEKVGLAINELKDGDKICMYVTGIDVDGKIKPIRQKVMEVSLKNVINNHTDGALFFQLTIENDNK